MYASQTNCEPVVVFVAEWRQRALYAPCMRIHVYRYTAQVRSGHAWRALCCRTAAFGRRLCTRSRSSAHRAPLQWRGGVQCADHLVARATGETEDIHVVSAYNVTVILSLLILLLLLVVRAEMEYGGIRNVLQYLHPLYRPLFRAVATDIVIIKNANETVRNVYNKKHKLANHVCACADGKKKPESVESTAWTCSRPKTMFTVYPIGFEDTNIL